MIKVLGEEMVEKMFNFAKIYNQLNLTKEEQALILPIIICINGNIKQKKTNFLFVLIRK